MQLSRATQYAILAMAQLKTDGDPVPCSQLAKLGDMPERFLLQVLRSLVNANLLRSTRGVDGGYLLAVQARDISLLDIVEAIEGKEEVKAELLGVLPKTEGKMITSALALCARERRNCLQSRTLEDFSVA